MGGGSFDNDVPAHQCALCPAASALPCVLVLALPARLNRCGGCVERSRKGMLFGESESARAIVDWQSRACGRFFVMTLVEESQFVGSVGHGGRACASVLQHLVGLWAAVWPSADTIYRPNRRRRALRVQLDGAVPAAMPDPRVCVGKFEVIWSLLAKPLTSGGHNYRSP